MGQPGIYLTGKEISSVVTLRGKGVPLREIARRELISLTTVKRILKNNVDKIPEKVVN